LVLVGHSDDAIGGNEDIYIAFGSNLGSRASNIIQALEKLKVFSRVVALSHLYETPARYNTQQPPFLNGVAKVRGLFFAVLLENVDRFFLLRFIVNLSPLSF
jgi:2-amino-4-hydroxy-6-hydroxymethyldihydropteridine diphosphokinase